MSKAIVQETLRNGIYNSDISSKYSVKENGFTVQIPSYEFDESHIKEFISKNGHNFEIKVDGNIVMIDKVSYFKDKKQAEEHAKEQESFIITDIQMSMEIFV